MLMSGCEGGPDGGPTHAVGADVVAHLEAQGIAIERDRLVVIVDRQEAGIQFHVHGPEPTRSLGSPLLES